MVLGSGCDCAGTTRGENVRAICVTFLQILKLNIGLNFLVGVKCFQAIGLLHKPGRSVSRCLGTLSPVSE